MSVNHSGPVDRRPRPGTHARTNGGPGRTARTCQGAERLPRRPIEKADRSELARLLPLWPHELVATAKDERLRLLARLRRALREERRRGIAGDWTYDLARHSQLLRAYRAELVSFLDHFGSQAVNGPGREPG